MAIYGQALRQAAAARDEHARLTRSLGRDFGEYVVVPGEWHTKQSEKAVLFPTYGWVAKSLIRSRNANGTVRGWDQHREGDEFMLPTFVLERAGLRCPECGRDDIEDNGERGHDLTFRCAGCHHQWMSAEGRARPAGE